MLDEDDGQTVMAGEALIMSQAQKCASPDPTSFGRSPELSQQRSFDDLSN